MFIEVKNIVKKYDSGGVSNNAIDDLSVSIDKGEIVVVLGPSGSGKTTFLNVMGGLDNVNSGSVNIGGETITSMKRDELIKFRKKNLGYIFQFYNLIADLSLEDNVRVGEYLTKTPLNRNDIIEELGLSQHKNKFPSQLSGGQQQRCSIARAIVKNPALLLCDEPTGALDSKSAKEIMALLENINKKYQMTMIIVTHNEIISQMADRIIMMKDGKIIHDYQNEDKKSASELEF